MMYAHASEGSKGLRSLTCRDALAIASIAGDMGPEHEVQSRASMTEQEARAWLQVVLEEFGKWIKPGTSATLAERDEFYQAVYQEIQAVCPDSLLLVLLCESLALARWIDE